MRTLVNFNTGTGRAGSCLSRDILLSIEDAIRAVQAGLRGDLDGRSRRDLDALLSILCTVEEYDEDAEIKPWVDDAVRDARDEWEAEREDAVEDARSKGYAEGYADGEREGRKAVRDEWRDRVERFGDIAARARARADS